MNAVRIVWFLVKVAVGSAVLITIIYTDITAQMKFTEDTRNGLYEAAYQKGIPK